MENRCFGRSICRKPIFSSICRKPIFPFFPLKVDPWEVKCGFSVKEKYYRNIHEIRLNKQLIRVDTPLRAKEIITVRD